MESTVLIPIKKFKIISKSFRRVSGDLLYSTDIHETMRLAIKFIAYIENESIIYDFIRKCHTQDYDIEEILNSKAYESKYDIPIDNNEEISFIYQLLKYATENLSSYNQLTYGYALYKGAKFSDQVREFNYQVVRLLVNHITDYLEEMAIELGIDEKPNAKVLIQGNVGQFNYAEQGNIEAIQTNNQGENNDLQKVAQELIELLKGTSLENKNIQEDAIDFVGEVAQNIEEGQSPKPSLLRRATESLTDINSMVESGSQIAIKIGQFLSLLNS
ncbi:hypothetical protein OWO94_26315 [Bacillus paranthracis]|uniref:Uncharacterized protein n=4 Tax=Bacillus TaxID=1386 RepID=A1BZN1_BACCE|nr:MULTISPECIES: hypothetical protein [Bacillus cereus group]ABK00832.1 hypothetical protein pPER272_AH820_0206 [Bacillus cereus]ABK01097.1 hypothetical protein pPER272_0206 [Bacillus cereus]ACK92899.1 conserved hypothetical protein [Bacillus cereus AH820]MCU5059476.1 hypothetical protein [Bacillus cereus]MDK7541359.1 hypothetical protein [Bacillus paranthracis]